MRCSVGFINASTFRGWRFDLIVYNMLILRLRDLSKTLNLSNEEGEKWIVNLIRDSRIGVEAKIDLKSVSYCLQ